MTGPLEQGKGGERVFLGDYQHTLDAKGRISLPAKFRNQLAGSLVVSKGLEKCLYVYPAAGWREFEATLLSGNDFDGDHRGVRRFFMAGSTETELDSAGRVTLPPGLRAYAGLDKDVSVIGNGDRIELWDTERWAAYSGAIGEGIEDAAGKLASGSSA
jgi:MraZ protein